MIGLLRTLILLTMRQNVLLGGAQANKVGSLPAADDLDAPQWIQVGQNALSAIVDLGIDQIKLQ